MASRSPLDFGQFVAALVAGLLGAAVGIICAAEPRAGILAALGMTFVALVLSDLFFGYATMALFAFLEVLTVVNGVSLAKLAGAVIVLGWLASASVRRSDTRNFFRDHPGLSYLLLAFVGWNLMSVAWAESTSTGISSVMRYGLDAFLLPIGYAAVRDRRDATRILAVIVVGATIAAIAAVLSPPGVESGGYSRATGTVGDPNELAAVLVVGLSVATAFAANRHIRAQWRTLAAISALLCFLGIMLSLSRGGLIAFGAALILAVCISGRWRRPVLAASGLLAGAAVFYFGLIASVPAMERVVTLGGGSGRVSIWTIGVRMFTANPIQGVGTGQFQTAAVHYLLQPGLITRGELILFTPKVTHNTYLNVLDEVGLLGLAAFLAIIAFCIWCHWAAIQRFRRDQDYSLELLARGSLIGLGGFLVAIFFVSGEYMKLLWILLALGPIMLTIASQCPSLSSSPPVTPLNQGALP